MTSRLRPLLSSAAAAGAALLVAVLLAAAAFGLETTFRSPSQDQKLALDALAGLAPFRAMRSVETFPGLGSFHVACSRQHGRDVVDLGRGRRIVTVNGRVRALGRRFARPLLLAAVDLAGCPHRVAGELAARLVSGTRMLAGERRVDGIPALAIRIGGSRPLILLYVSRRGLRPIGMRFATQTLRAQSDLELPPTEQRRPAVLSGGGRDEAEQS